MGKRKYIIVLGIVLSIVLVACGGGDSESAPTETALPPTDTLVPSLTPTEIPTRVPNPTLPPTSTSEADAIEPTITPIRVTVEPLTGEQFPPPLTIDVPDDWQNWYDTLVYNNVENELTSTRFANFFGSIEGGVGSIVVLWGFSSTATIDRITGEMNIINFYTQGLRLFGLLIAEIDCNTSFGDEQQFNIGTYPAVGASITAIDCPQYPNLAGWFAGLQVDGVNFLFYVYAEPDDALTTENIDTLQAMLNSVQFNVPEFLATYQAELTAEATLDLTPQAEVTDQP